MSATNSTTNYHMSQFIGTDKPAWLSDYNGDMAKIDAQMKLNADGVTSASGSATTANTNIGTMANLGTTDKTSLVGAINEVNTNLGTVSGVANSASTTASSASNKADTALSDLAKFNLTQKSTLSVSSNNGTVDTNVANTNVQFATDSTNSIFKVYGRILISNVSGSGDLVITLGQTSLRPETAYDINAGLIFGRTFVDGYTDAVPRNLHVATNGVITITDTSSRGANVTGIVVSILPCLYFNSDFGDQ